MKRFLIITLASVIVASGCFTVLYFIFRMAAGEALNISISAAIAGMVVEYIRPLFTRLDMQQKDRIDKRVRRNLGRHKRTNG